MARSRKLSDRKIKKVTRDIAARPPMISHNPRRTRNPRGTDEALKFMLEKGQVFAAQSQASEDRPTPGKPKVARPKSVFPARQAAPDVLRSRSGTPHQNDEHQPAEFERQVEQGLRDAATMRPEDFWRQDNLDNMTEGQVMTHMIEHAVQRQLDPKKYARDYPIAAALMIPSAQLESDSDDLPRSMSTTRKIKGGRFKAKREAKRRATKFYKHEVNMAVDHMPKTARDARIKGVKNKNTIKK
ncbi:MAG: Uncharacterized protein AUREO_022480 [Aureobasidium pullulans]|nr:MAG: Uncharacterized protein AUREO_022480 [Aureobasidium pullulans]